MIEPGISMSVEGDDKAARGEVQSLYHYYKKEQRRRSHRFTVHFDPKPTHGAFLSILETGSLGIQPCLGL